MSPKEKKKEKNMKKQIRRNKKAKRNWVFAVVCVLARADLIISWCPGCTAALLILHLLFCVPCPCVVERSVAVLDRVRGGACRSGAAAARSRGKYRLAGQGNACVVAVRRVPSKWCASVGLFVVLIFGIFSFIFFTCFCFCLLCIFKRFFGCCVQLFLNIFVTFVPSCVYAD
jgi:hypothetical protein